MITCMWSVAVSQWPSLPLRLHPIYNPLPLPPSPSFSSTTSLEAPSPSTLAFFAVVWDPPLPFTVYPPSACQPSACMLRITVGFFFQSHHLCLNCLTLGITVGGLEVWLRGAAGRAGTGTHRLLTSLTPSSCLLFWEFWLNLTGRNWVGVWRTPTPWITHCLVVHAALMPQPRACTPPSPNHHCPCTAGATTSPTWIYPALHPPVATLEEWTMEPSVSQFRETTCLSSSTPSNLSTSLAGPPPGLTLGTLTACHHLRPQPQNCTRGASTCVAQTPVWTVATQRRRPVCLGSMASRVCLQRTQTEGAVKARMIAQVRSGNPSCISFEQFPKI